MRYLFAVISLLSTASYSLAQQGPPQPSIDDFKKTLSVVQAQRNRALDSEADVTARAMSLMEENTKLKSEIEELKKKLETAGK